MQFRDFLPVSTNTSVKESCYGALGALIGLLGTALLCRWGLGLEVHWLIAPMGASAVLLFGLCTAWRSNDRVRAAEHRVADAAAAGPDGTSPRRLSAVLFMGGC